MGPRRRLAAVEASLRKFALAYPETVEEFPWGHRAMKVRGKVFVFIALDEGVLSLSVKLPHSSASALVLPFVSPTGYGLGRSGWVTARFDGEAQPPVELLEEWIDESFRAVAPKRLGDSPGTRGARPPKPRRRKVARRRGGPARP
jgi:predicted DNA-binding protein (MmcQ/YjbR family)